MASPVGWLARDASFGVPLEEAARHGLPAVFSSCLAWLKRHALQVDALFVKKADGRAVLAAKRAFEAGRDPVAAGQVSDPHTVAGVLKLWLACLPQPVLRPELARALCELEADGSAGCDDSLAGRPAAGAWDREERLDATRAVLSKAAPHVLELLYSLCEFLHHYQLNARWRRARALPPPDLPRVFAPLLMPLGRGAGEGERAAAVGAAARLIADYRPIFTRPRVRLPPHPAAPGAAPSPASSPSTKSPRRLGADDVAACESPMGGPGGGLVGGGGGGAAAQLVHVGGLLRRDPLLLTDSDSDVSSDGSADSCDSAGSGGCGGACLCACDAYHRCASDARSPRGGSPRACDPRGCLGHGDAVADEVCAMLQGVSLLDCDDAWASALAAAASALGNSPAATPTAAAKAAAAADKRAALAEAAPKASAGGVVALVAASRGGLRA